MTDPSKSYRAPAGMPDILPEQTPLWVRLEETVRRLFPRYGYREIRTPVLEETRLFVRSVGEATDIVEKEMYTLPGGGDEDSLTLRPEMTAAVVRAMIEHQTFKQKSLLKYFYMGPVFRKERPQKGRFRQHHQLGVELFGSADPLADVETIMLYRHLLRELGVSSFELKLNSIGCMTCRGGFRERLRMAMKEKLPNYCPDCKKRFDRNPFRIFDCKVEGCLRLNADLPKVTDHLCEPCGGHFTAVRAGLDRQSVSYLLDPRLVRGLDYYTRTVFEFTSDVLGSQNSLSGGGRYDTLVQDLGGPPMGAVGFGAGMERLIMAMEALSAGEAVPPGVDFYLVSISAEFRSEAYKLLSELRQAGLSGDMDYEGRSVKAQMREGTRAGARAVLILGPDEVSNGQVKVKDMKEGAEQPVGRSEIVPFLRRTYAS